MGRVGVLVASLSLITLPLWAQGPAQPSWTFRTRAILTGNSAESEPLGYTMFSAIALEVALTRRLGRLVSVELGVRTESREVDYQPGDDPAERLGSLEFLPLNLLVRLHPARSGRWHPYVGVGVNMTVAWEKSGVLDSMDVRPHMGPAAQLGVDLDLSPIVLFNLDLRWNTLTTEIENGGVRYASLKVDPIAIGVGLGFRF